MLKSKEDILVDELFRSNYGPDYTWDSGSQSLGYRKGVGKLQGGPTKPKVSIPTGQIAELTPFQAAIPTAIAASSVVPSTSTASLGDTAAVERAILKARAYINSQ